MPDELMRSREGPTDGGLSHGLWPILQVEAQFGFLTFLASCQIESQKN